MSVLVEDSKVFTPFVPSLFHSALVQVTLPLLNTFGNDIINKAAVGIEREKSPESNESSRENSDENYKRAKEILKKIPERLRWCVCETSTNLRFKERDWKLEHPGFRDVECIFHWNFYGTIDRIKTAEQFILNANNNIRKRFEMASMYCLKESIQDLWTKMEISGDTEYFIGTDEFLDGDEDESLVGDEEDSLEDDADDSLEGEEVESLDGDSEHFDGANESIVRFWVRWIMDGSRVPWPRALLELDSDNAFDSLKNYNSFLPLLQPEERQDFLRIVLRHSDWDDFRLCLYSLTEAEEKLLLLREPLKVFLLYLEWPLRSLFVETAKQIIKYMDGEKFQEIVECMLQNTMDGTFSDDVQLFQGLWDISPDTLKDVVRADRDLFPELEEYFVVK